MMVSDAVPVDLHTLSTPKKTLLPSRRTVLLFIAAFLSSKYLEKHPPSWLNFTPSGSSISCKDHHYTTEIISTDPLLIYINNFITPLETSNLIALSTPLFQHSQVQYYTGDSSSSISNDRSSHSAFFQPPFPPIISCILSRAWSFLGPTMRQPEEEALLSMPQVVRYTEGQKFSLHHDWFPELQPLQGRRGWFYNRVATLFVYLDSLDEEVGGETWFPHIRLDGARKDPEGRWKSSNGTSFMPRKGNALMWVNLHKNGTGDERTEHAGLEMKEGSGAKHGMNIWARQILSLN